MDDAKVFYKSITFWAIVGGLVTHLALAFGIPADEANRWAALAREFGPGVVDIIASAVALWGRFRATAPLVLTKPPAPPAPPQPEAAS
jgi:hypothetical protein